MNRRTRREFVRDAAIAGTTMAAGGFNVLGQGSPNAKVVVAVMGVRSRGTVLARLFAEMANTEVAVICDVDDRYLSACIDEVASVQGATPVAEKDIRRVLERPEIDALVVASPDHWHAPAAILAVSAGKHVYLEKPCGHNPREGELLIAAETKYNRIIHMGNQRRSWPNVIRCMQELKSGIIGRVYMAKGWYANNRGPIGFGQPAPVPEYLDWKLWQGPAPRTSYRDNYHPYNWHWFRRWGTGEALNNGTHELDVMRWGLGVEFPTRVLASGGRYAYRDDWQFPDTMVLTLEFGDDATITWESRSCNAYPTEGDGRGVVFYGENGTVVQLRNGYTIYSNEEEPQVVKQVVDPEDVATDPTDTAAPNRRLTAFHIENFLDGIRTGTPVSSPIDEAHRSILLGHLGNIAWYTGRILDIDQRNGYIVGDREAMSYWGRDYEPGWAPHV